LIDDPKDTVLHAFANRENELTRIYSTDLMLGGGRVTGYFTESQAILDDVEDALLKLKRHDEMLMAVGDGNHSLATAKTVWDEAKKKLSKKEREDHPLRYALTEIVNLYDEGLTFEPIHRVLFNVEPGGCLVELVNILNEKDMEASLMFTSSNTKKVTADKKGHTLVFEGKDRKGKIIVKKPKHVLEAGTLQEALDEYLKRNERVSIDYIHGEKAFQKITDTHDCLGFRLSAIEKKELFKTIGKCGVLPRKTFSMGEPQEKRYYIEARLLMDIAEEKTAADDADTITEKKTPDKKA